MGNLNTNTDKQGTGMFLAPNQPFSITNMNVMAKNTAFLCRSYETALSAMVRIELAIPKEGTVQNSIVLPVGTYLFQWSIYSHDGDVSDGSLLIGGKLVVGTTIDSPTPIGFYGSYVFKVTTPGRYVVLYRGKRDSLNTMHSVWVAYRPLLQDL